MTIDTSKRFFRIRQESPKHFTQFRLPQFASNIADAVVPGAKVITGKSRDGEWRAQSILILKKGTRNVDSAIKKAKLIKKKLTVSQKKVVWKLDNEFNEKNRAEARVTANLKAGLRSKITKGKIKTYAVLVSGRRKL